MNTILFTLSISLFDSLSTTQQIIIFVLLLTTLKPLHNALWFLTGLMGAYFTCGVAGFLVLDKVHILLNKFFPSGMNMSDLSYYQSELFTGVVMIVIGIWYFCKKRNYQPGHVENMLVKRLRSINSLASFGIGVIISITSFPFSIPYIVALGRYTALHFGLS